MLKCFYPHTKNQRNSCKIIYWIMPPEKILIKSESFIAFLSSVLSLLPPWQKKVMFLVYLFVCLYVC